MAVEKKAILKSLTTEISDKNKGKIRDFIKNNHLSFKYGRRNSDSVILAGYCLHIKCKDVDNIIKIMHSEVGSSHDYDDEFQRVFKYAINNNYERFWKTEESKKQYTF